MPEAIQTNGHNPSSSSSPAPPPSQKNPQDESASTTLAEFIVNTTVNSLTPPLSLKLKALFLDFLGVSTAAGHAAESTPSFLASVTAFATQSSGKNTVMTKGLTFPPQYAALLNAAFCHSYDFDDTHAKAILHPGSALIAASLAEAEIQNSSGEDFLLALLVGYEIAVRLGMALGPGSYRRGFHNTATVGVYGAVAAVCKLRKCSPSVVQNAFGLAVSRAAGSMQFLENGSWNKRLHPGFAAHDALFIVTMAEHGVLGAAKPIEGKYGLLHNFSEDADGTHLTENLGSVWNFLDTACKPFPACRMTHGCLEMAGNLAESNSSKGLPNKIQVTLPPENVAVVGFPSDNKIQPKSIVDGQFSVYFQTAAAWLYGNNLGWAIYEHIQDEKVYELCKRIEVTKDDRYKSLESRMEVWFEDGTRVEEEVIFPIAEPERPFEWDTGVQRKFLGLVEPVHGAEVARRVCGLVEGIEGVKVAELLKLLA